MSMTPRQRVLTALNQQQPDRIPVDFSSHRSSGIAAVAYHKLRKFLRLSEKPVRVYDIIQQLAVVDQDVLDRFGIDTIEMGRGFLLEDKDWKDWILPDGSPCCVPCYVNLEKRGEDWFLLSDDGIPLALQKKGSLYFEQVHFPLAQRGIENDDFADLEKMIGRTAWAGLPPPGAHLPLHQPYLTEMAQKSRILRQTTDRAIIGLFGGNLFELPQWLYRMDNYLMYLNLYPQAVMRLSEKLCQIHLGNLEKWLHAVGPYIDIIAFGDDFGTQNGPLISPQMYRRYFKPYHQKLFRRAKELADVKVMFHCCGGVRELLGDLIEAGLDAINPVQINCTGMDPVQLKAQFGKDLAFWGGGCDANNILNHAKTQQIAHHVKRQTNILSPGGGFVFQQTHNILADTPPKNIAAMFDSVN